MFVFLVCSTPPPLDEGFFIPTENLYNEGDEVTYFCPVGYTLIGSDVNTCTANGAWSFVVAPSCSLECKIFWDATYQRWSRGHKARGQGQGQGHKKNPRPRPRTALPRTEPLEAKDRNARGQGQGPRTQVQVFSKKKKVFKNFFQAISNSLAYPEFIGISLNHKSNEMTSSKIFQSKFLWDKHIVGWKI